MSRNDILCCLVVILPKSAGSGQLVALCNDTLLYCDRAWLKWWQYTLYVAFHIYIYIYNIYVCVLFPGVSCCISILAGSTWRVRGNQGELASIRHASSSFQSFDLPAMALVEKPRPGHRVEIPGSPQEAPGSPRKVEIFLIIFQTANQWFSHRNVCENHGLPILLWHDGDITIFNKYVYI